MAGTPSTATQDEKIDPVPAFRYGQPPIGVIRRQRDRTGFRRQWAPPTLPWRCSPTRRRPSAPRPASPPACASIIVPYGDLIQLQGWSAARSTPPTAGTRSAHTDTDSVARDLVEGLSFAETVAFEANSVIVIVGPARPRAALQQGQRGIHRARAGHRRAQRVFEMFMTRRGRAARAAHRRVPIAGSRT